MKTTSLQHQRAESVRYQREAHHKALESLRAPSCKLSGLQIWRKLRKLENIANRMATDYCNGDASYEDWQAVKNSTFAAMAKMLAPNRAFIVQGDPRGFSIQWNCDVAPVPDGMHRNWGGNGCLAPVIE